MWHLTAYKISVSLSFLNLIKNWNDFLSSLWINVGNINSEILLKIISFLIQFKTWNVTGCQDRINTIYQFIKPFFDKQKCLFLRNMEPLRETLVRHWGVLIFKIYAKKIHYQMVKETKTNTL